MESTPPTQSILETLRTVEFRLGLKGYNVDEVDEYLEKAAVEAESVQEQLRAANERVQRANDRVAQLELELQRAPGERVPAASEGALLEAQVADDTLQRTLLLAQRFVDQTKRESEAEAAEIVSRAEERARHVVSQAEERARQMSNEAEQRLRDEVSRLEGLRTRLAEDVEAMTRHLEEQRTRIRASLTEALKWLDERVQPASSLMTVRGRGEEKGNEQGGAPARAQEPSRPAPAPERKPSPLDPRGGAGTPDRSQPPVGARLRSLGGGQTEELFEGGRRSE